MQWCGRTFKTSTYKGLHKIWSPTSRTVLSKMGMFSLSMLTKHFASDSCSWDRMKHGVIHPKPSCSGSLQSKYFFDAHLSGS